MHVRGELRERYVAPELDSAERVGQRELRVKAGQVDEPKHPREQTASVSLLPRGEGVDVCEIFKVVRAGDVDRRHDVPVHGSVDTLPGVQSRRLGGDSCRAARTVRLRR